MNETEHGPAAAVRPPNALELHVWLWSISRRLQGRGWRKTSRIIKALNFYLHHCLLPAEAVVGANIRLDHYAHGVVIHPNVIIGDSVRIYHDVTIASENSIGSSHGIHIGNRVTIGVGAKIIGTPGRTMTIGDGSKIGAGAVVTRDIPDGETWVGVPARAIVKQP